MAGLLPENVSVGGVVAPRADIAEALGVAEALLEAACADARDIVAYLWRPNAQGVVLGSACRINAEVDRDACQRLGVGIFRRVSGGGTVLVGPETWCYSCVLSKALDPGSIHHTFAWLHEVVIAVLARFGIHAERAPISDLVVRMPKGDLRKLAGHSQKRTRRGVLCEGTLLAGPFPFPMSEVLTHPPREPEYRRGRSHEEFVTDLRALDSEIAFEDFAGEFLSVVGAVEAGELPAEIAARAEEFVQERYLTAEWTERL